MNSKDIMGKPVVAIRAGKVIGKIRYPIVDASKQEITGFIIDDDKWYIETKIVLFPLVRGTGNDVATVDDASSVMSISKLRAIERQLEEHVQLIGHKVITETGKVVGYIEDYSFDNQTGKIETYAIQNNHVQVRQQEVMSIGKDLMIIAAEPLAAYSDIRDSQPGQMVGDINSIFERRQMEFVLGKRLSRSVETDEGYVIASQGQVVSMDTVLKAKNKGKFTELVMSIEPQDWQ